MSVNVDSILFPSVQECSSHKHRIPARVCGRGPSVGLHPCMCYCTFVSEPLCLYTSVKLPILIHVPVSVCMWAPVWMHFFNLIYLFVYSALIYYILTMLSSSSLPRPSPLLPLWVHFISWCLYPHPCLELRTSGPPQFFALLRRKPPSGFPRPGTLGEGPAGAWCLCTVPSFLTSAHILFLFFLPSPLPYFLPLVLLFSQFS